jgi:sporulation protein YlmC with PRC-barrel domain
LFTMEIEYGMTVADKNGKTLGKVGYVIMDGWSGEPRKYMVRREEEDDAVFFTPEQVAEVIEKKVTLNVSVEELDQT